MRLAAQDLKLKLVYLMLIVLVVSIFSGATPITQAKNLHKYSGEEIFAGIVFGQGEISKNFLKFGTPTIIMLEIQINLKNLLNC